MREKLMNLYQWHRGNLEWSEAFPPRQKKSSSQTQIDSGICGGATSNHKTKRGSALDQRLHIVIYGLKVILLSLALFLNIGLAVLQKSIGISGAVIFTFFLVASSLLLTVAIFCVRLVHYRWSRCSGAMHALHQNRINLILVGVSTVFALILSTVATIASQRNGCRDAASDPHASDSDWPSKLPTFCGVRRALAAFLWLAATCWLASLVLAIRHWKETRSPKALPAFTQVEAQQYRGTLSNADAVEAEDEPYNPPANLQYAPTRPRPRQGDQRASYMQQPTMAYDSIPAQRPAATPLPMLQVPSYSQDDPFVKLQERYNPAPRSTDVGRHV